MKKPLKIAGIVAIATTGVAIILYTGINIFFNSRSPVIDGVFHAEGISDKTTVIRDNWGVPHITAQNGSDAYFAYGFTIAQDRLFQMELQRRLALGELSEILGPSFLKIDRMFRTYLLKQTAEEYLKHPEKINPEALKLLDSFLAGVNHFVKTQKLPVEYALIGHKPREFTRLDVLGMFGYMAYSFTDAIDTDSLNTILKEKCPDRNINELFPGYTKEEPVTIMETSADFKESGTISAEKGPDPQYKLKKPAGSDPAADYSASKSASNRGPDPLNLNPGPDPQNRNTKSSLHQRIITNIHSHLTGSGFSNKQSKEPTFRELAARICPPFKGSNSWVIAPSRSASGRAILANDPHVALTHPGVWYEAHISFPGFEIYGYHIPIIPFPMLGHNSNKAWAVTMFENDDLDLYAETINPSDPSQVMYRGKWTKITLLKEIIKVKGQSDETLEIRITPHGPIISEFIEGYSGKPVSMWWAYHKVDNPVIDIVHGLSRSSTIEQFRQAASKLAAPGLNLSYADSRGNIAWWGAGRIPVRPKHVNSREILDGASGRDEILRLLPFSQNPHMINPSSGIIVTANNKSTSRPVGPISDLEGYWVPTDRAARITVLLSAREKWSIDELKKVQTDLHPMAAKAVIGTVAKIIESNEAEFKKFSTTEQTAYEHLKSWDMESTVTSTGASIYHVLTYHILKEAIEDELGLALFLVYSDSTDYWSFFKALVRDETSAFWDNRLTAGKETREDIIFTAYRKTVKELKDKIGRDVNSWNWGKIHTIEYMHPIGSKKPMNLIFNIGALPSPGEAHHVNRLKSNFGLHDYKVTSVPSTRRLIDFGDLEQSFSILPAGNSGDVKSVHYGDQVKMFLNGEYRNINFSKEQIRNNTKHTMEFLPVITAK
jgi:penicillin amidase